MISWRYFAKNAVLRENAHTCLQSWRDENVQKRRKFVRFVQNTFFSSKILLMLLFSRVLTSLSPLFLHFWLFLTVLRQDWRWSFVLMIWISRVRHARFANSGELSTKYIKNTNCVSPPLLELFLLHVVSHSISVARVFIHLTPCCGWRQCWSLYVYSSKAKIQVI
jgi:hypothetical protein